MSPVSPRLHRLSCVQYYLHYHLVIHLHLKHNYLQTNRNHQHLPYYHAGRRGHYPHAGTNEGLTSTEIISSTTVRVQTTTTSTSLSTGGAATMALEMGVGAMAAAAMGFAAML